MKSEDDAMVTISGHCHHQTDQRTQDRNAEVDDDQTCHSPCEQVTIVCRLRVLKIDGAVSAKAAHQQRNKHDGDQKYEFIESHGSDPCLVNRRVRKYRNHLFRNSNESVLDESFQLRALSNSTSGMNKAITVTLMMLPATMAATGVTMPARLRPLISL